MDRRAKIFLGVSALVVIGLGIVVYKYNHPSVVANSTTAIATETQKLSEEINKNVKFTTETQTVRFKTADEMATYAKKINTIKDLNEATNFITDFYNSAAKNDLSNLITYYHSTSRQGVIKNEAFPILDKQGIFNFKITNLKVTESNDKNSNYNTTYTIEVYKKEDNSLYGTIKRQDKLYVIKEFGKMYVMYYSKNTISTTKS